MFFWCVCVCVIFFLLGGGGGGGGGRVVEQDSGKCGVNGITCCHGKAIFDAMFS